MTLSPRHRRLMLIATLLGAILLVYFPGIYGNFYFDDHPNIVQNSGLAMDTFSLDELQRASHSSSAGPLGRPVAMATFALNYHFSALDPLPYKLTNIAIHGVNAGLLLLFLMLLGKSVLRQSGNPVTMRTRCWSVALFATALWALHPLNVTSVLYVVQRMTSLSVMFSLLALICYLLARTRIHLHWRWPILGALGLTGFGTLAVLSKETALLLPVLILVLEFTLFNHHPDTPRYWKILMRSALAAGVLITLLWCIKNIVLGDWAQIAYATRPFTLQERVLSEGRIVWQYWAFILLPDIQQMGLYLDDVIVSKDILTPWTTLPSLLAHGLLIGIGIRLRKRQPVAAFGILWFYAGHLLESTIYPLELMYEHRNYLPMIGPLYAIAHYGVNGLERLSDRMRPIAKASAWLLIALLATGTLMRAQHFGNAWTFAFGEAKHHPNSARANFFAGRICSQLAVQQPKGQYLDCALMHLRRSAEANPSAAEALISMVQALLDAQRPVPESLLDELETRLRTQPLGNHGAFLAKGLLEIATKQSTNVSDARIDRFFSAAVHNPRLTRDTRAHMLVAQGIMLCEIRKQCASGGIMAFQKAAATEPTAQFFVILATYQIFAGDMPGAMETLDKADKHDNRLLFHKTISGLRNHASKRLGKPSGQGYNS